VAVKDVSKSYEETEESRYRIREELKHLSFGEKTFPRFPAFLAEEHFKRKGVETEQIRHLDVWEGILAEEKTVSGDKNFRYGVTNNYDQEEDRISLSVGFDSETLEGFTDKNRENYIDKIYEQRLETQINRIMDASIAAANFVTGTEDLPDLEDIRENYSERYEEEIGVMEAVEREFRLLGGENFDPEAENYIEAVTENYLSGNITRPSPLLLHYNKTAENSPTREGNMPLTEENSKAIEADGSGKHRENLSHYLDLVWQIAAEKDLSQNR